MREKIRDYLKAHPGVHRLAPVAFIYLFGYIFGGLVLYFGIKQNDLHAQGLAIFFLSFLTVPLLAGGAILLGSYFNKWLMK